MHVVSFIRNNNLMVHGLADPKFLFNIILRVKHTIKLLKYGKVRKISICRLMFTVNMKKCKI